MQKDTKKYITRYNAEVIPNKSVVRVQGGKSIIINRCLENLKKTGKFSKRLNSEGTSYLELTADEASPLKSLKTLHFIIE